MPYSPYDPHSPEGADVPLRRPHPIRDRRLIDLESSMIIPSLSGHHDKDELRLLVHEAQLALSSVAAMLQAITRAVDKHSCTTCEYTDRP
ncbi:hypothetical protein [Allokutzneria albata]|uniref:Uncharacterized protein n=2 Tax=Allokutzneria albata TaxID=211114 RepID=A0A1G9YAN4_ALLAB|nr:hypothetical protein [Allokutzneria albata]SDN06209.1 hypothetical protein SAMN04489726_4707 [Allokutzneria albata]